MPQACDVALHHTVTNPAWLVEMYVGVGWRKGVTNYAHATTENYGVRAGSQQYFNQLSNNQCNHFISSTSETIRTFLQDTMQVLTELQFAVINLNDKITKSVNNCNKVQYMNLTHIVVACSFITGSYDRTCKIWDTASEEELHTLEGHRNVVYAIAYNNPFGSASLFHSDALMSLFCRFFFTTAR